MGEDRAGRQSAERQQPFERSRQRRAGARRRRRHGLRRRGHARPSPRSRARSPASRTVSSETVKLACSPTRPRSSGEAATRRHSAGPRRALVAAEIALGRAVAEQRADAELLAGLGEDRERALDEIRRFVMVDQRRRSREQRARHIVARRRAQGFGVERAVEPPPDPFQDLQEVLRRRTRRRHAIGREAAVDDGCGRRPRRARSRRRDRRGAPRPPGARGDHAAVDDRDAAAAAIRADDDGVRSMPLVALRVGDAADIDRPRGRRILHRQAHAPYAVVSAPARPRRRPRSAPGRSRRPPWRRTDPRARAPRPG